MAVILIPLKLLWKVQINIRQKLALLAIFFLTAVTMVFSLVRVVVGLKGPREDDVWLFFCAIIELTIGNTLSLHHLSGSRANITPKLL